MGIGVGKGRQEGTGLSLNVEAVKIVAVKTLPVWDRSGDSHRSF